MLDHLSTVRATPVPIRIEGLGFFDRAGVFWAGVALTPELLALQQLITAAMRSCGFIPEDRPYSPHITLARAKGRGGSKALAPLKKALEKPPALNDKTVSASFTAHEFLLYLILPRTGRLALRNPLPLPPEHLTGARRSVLVRYAGSGMTLSRPSPSTYPAIPTASTTAARANDPPKLCALAK